MNAIGTALKSVMSVKTPVLEGVFAINKPAAISSAQVLRDLQTHFNPSKTFAPWIAREEADRARESHNQRNKRSRRSRQPVQVKLGHGGTLDPAATGVLIVGVGKGTKSLNKFLDCTKSYEAVVLFGAATDTYDAEGKVVNRAGYEHVTEQKVRDALAQFRGPIKQIPPIFSALRVQGKRMYEYAREGKDIPQLEPRAMKVDEMEMLEWYEGGKHEHHWPTREADKEERTVVETVLRLGEKVDTITTVFKSGEVKEDLNEVSKRKREDEDTADTGAEPEQASEKKIKTDDTSASEETAAQSHEPAPTEPSERLPCPAPAARIRMTVSSGFYVRSLCHDLGIAVGSFGLMSTLVRTRQERFFLGKNVLEYDELAKGEDVWAPKVLEMLAEWDDNVGGSKNEQPEPKSEPIEQQAQGRRRNSSSEPEG
ncbi:hypothetical protein MBLNU457_5875t1 [Dothideomycetes sp. NU457]